jgi:DNA-binding NarL/FixJ family response regulator
VASRVAIIDDHALVRDGLETALVRGGFDVVCSTGEVDEVLALSPVPDLVILDVELHRNQDPVLATRSLRFHGMRVLVVSAMARPAVVREMYVAGANGVMSKADPMDSLLEAVTFLCNGGKEWMTADLASALLSESGPRLSDQEQRALELYTAGLTIAKVAAHMNVAPSTVKEYLARVREKYSQVGRPARTRTDLLREALRDGTINSVD